MTESTARERIREDLLDLADFAYRRLRGRVEGLTDEEYLWEPAPDCWSVRPAGDGTFRPDRSAVPVKPAPLTTIAWRMCHLIDGLAAERNATWIGVTPTGSLDRDGRPGTAAAAVAQLEQAYELFRRHVAATDPAGLTVPMGAVAGPYAEHTRAAFVLHELDELIHHGAEVAAMRDLYRATRPVAPFVDAARRADRDRAEAALAADPELPSRHPELLGQLAAEQNWPAVRLLVDLGVDVNGSAGISALHYAAGAGELPVVRLLVAHGADRAAKDTEFDQSPIAWARYFDQPEVVTYLESQR